MKKILYYKNQISINLIDETINSVNVVKLYTPMKQAFQYEMTNSGGGGGVVPT